MRESVVELMPSRSASVTVEACPSGPHAARQRGPATLPSELFRTSSRARSLDRW